MKKSELKQMIKEEISKILDKSHSGKDVAAKMRQNYILEPFAKHVENLEYVTRQNLEDILPDYISGGMLTNLLKEYETYVDDEGVARDDEGNEEFVGKKYSGSTYGLKDSPLNKKKWVDWKAKKIKASTIKEEGEDYHKLDVPREFTPGNDWKDQDSRDIEILKNEKEELLHDLMKAYEEIDMLRAKLRYR